jgi:hypothetical protein
MVWYDFLIKKRKVSLHQCQRILGRGKYGVTYLTTDNLVVKIEVVDEDNQIGDKFGKDIVPTLPLEIKQHFTQIYGIQYLDYNPLPDLECIDKDTFNYKLKNAKKYKVSIMEYSGVPIDSLKLTNELRIEGFKQLFKPAFYALTLGYSHNDLHIGNITYDENKRIFKIIDYNSMTEGNNNFYPSWIMLFDNFLLHYFQIGEYYEFYNSIVKDFKFSGPNKYLKYPDLVNIYEIQMNPEKYKKLFESSEVISETFGDKNIMEALYYVYSYDFYKRKYDKSKSVEEYYQECRSEGYIEMFMKINEILKIDI